MSESNDTTTDAPATTQEATQRCPYCAEHVSALAKKCKHCGETLDVALRAAEEAKNSNSPNVYMNAGGGGGASAAASATAVGATVDAAGHLIKTKSRIVAALLAFFLGGIGIHKFYLGQTVLGVIYLLFSWTFIPAFVAIIEGVIYLCSTERAFALKYG